MDHMNGEADPRAMETAFGPIPLLSINLSDVSSFKRHTLDNCLQPHSICFFPSDPETEKARWLAPTYGASRLAACALDRGRTGPHWIPSPRSCREAHL